MPRPNGDCPNPLVVIPAFNEEGAIGEVVHRVRALGLNVLVVDDGSRDATYQIAKEAGAAVMMLSRNRGVGVAIQAAFRHAIDHGFDCVVQCDADGQHPVESIPRLIDASAGYDMVVGSRFLSPFTEMKLPPIRHATVKVLAWSATRSCGCRITDSTSGFRLVKQPLLGEFARTFLPHYLSDTYEALVAAGRANYRIVEIPAAFRERQSGAPSTGAVRSVLHVLRCMTKVTLHQEMKLSPAQTRE